MFSSIRKLPHPIPKAEKPDPKAAQALQEGLGGQFGEGDTVTVDAGADGLTLQRAATTGTRSR